MKVLTNLLTCLFYMLLVTSSNAKKTFSRSHVKEIIHTPTPIVPLTTVKENTCFYGTVNQMVTLMGDNVDAYSAKIDYTQDSELADLKKLAEAAINLEGESFKSSPNKESAAALYKEISSIAKKYTEFSFLSAVESVNEVSKVDIEKLFTMFWPAHDSVVEKIVKYNPRPIYFLDDYLRHIKYLRHKVIWNIKYEDKTMCFPTKTSGEISAYDELTQDMNCETLYLSKPGDNFILNDEDLIKKGGIAIAFWAKLSLENIKNGNNLIMQIINSENQTIKLNASENTDGSSIDLKITVGGQSHIINNSSPCNDMTFNTLVIQKEVESYKLFFISKSYNLNSRQIFTFKVPPKFIENASVSISSHSVDHSKILYATAFCYNPDEVDFTMRKELELVTNLIDENFSKDLDKLITVCDAPIPGCDYKDDEASCGVCDEEFYNYEGKCLPSCPEHTFTDQKYKACFDCHSNCLSCDSYDTCTSCKEGKNLYLQQCIDPCPSDTFPNEKVNEFQTKYNKCLPCTEDCKVCLNTDTCSSCKTNFLFEGKCLSECPKGFYQQNNPNECVKCIDNCAECNIADVCNICNEGFYLSPDNKCTAVCPKTYFANHETGRCEKCSDNCDNCVNKEECSKCSDGYNLFEKFCRSSCPEGTVSVGGVCVQCELNCLTCNANEVSFCTRCVDTMFNLNGDCVDICPEGMFADENRDCRLCLNGCKNCNDSSSCQRCLEPLSNFQNRECHEDCPFGWVSVDGSCNKCVGSCKICSENDFSECIQCFEGELLYKKSCIPVCPENTFIRQKECFDCESSCRTCDNPITCSSCREGEYFKYDTCVADCGEGWTISGDSCVPCKINHCKNCSTDVNFCNDCEDPYLLFNGECLEKCPAGFFKDGKKCSACSLHCHNCQNADVCDVCNTDHFLSIEKVCVNECPPNFSPNAFNECVKCEEPSCHRCDLNNQHCTICPLSTYFYEYKCLDFCPEGTVANQDLMICVNCTSPCRNCINVPDECTTCIDNYALLNKECTDKCPSNFANVNNVCEKCVQETCDTCSADNLSICENCITGNYLFNQRCYEECPDHFFEQVNGHCEKCIDNCLKCDEATICKECDDGFYNLNDTACVPNCGVGYSADPATKRCNRCGGNCSSCEIQETDNCTDCLLGKVLHEKRCIDNCPSGFFVDEKAVCRPCEVSQCKTCSLSGTVCDLCENNLLLLDNTCVPLCPLGYRVDFTNTRCEKCFVDQCSICNSDVTTCDTCKESFFLLDDNKCVSECPVGFFANLVDQECQSCSTSCVKCLDAERCVECDGAHVLRRNEKCYDTCPCGQVNQNGKCVFCGEYCNECRAENPEICIDCKKGYFLKADTFTCTAECGEKLFENDINGKCEPCSNQCKTCSSGEVCEQCEPGFNLHQNKCTDTCPDFFVALNNKCVECQTSNKCLKCSPNDLNVCVDCGKSILFNDRCIDNCPETYFLQANNTCEKCLDNCLLCDNTASCNQCISGFYLKDSICVANCGDNFVAVRGECFKCDDTNCKICDQNKQCKICHDNYSLFNHNGENRCVTECPDGFYSNNGVCNECTENSCQICPNSSTCVKCLPGFSLFGNNKCLHNCPATFASVDGVCKECETGCLKCDSAKLDSCLNCISPKVLFEADCLSYCPEKFVEKLEFPGVCTSCQPNCLKCCPKSNTCQICETGFYVSPDGNSCVQDCGAGYVAENGKCKPCTVENCGKCNSLEKVCIECKDNVVHADSKLALSLSLSIHDDECLEKCPDAQFSKNRKCHECNNCPLCADQSGECLDCYTGFFLHQGVCKQNCVDGQVKFDGNCLNCTVSGCKSCPGDDLSKCNECLDGKKLYENTCHGECPLTTFADPSNKYCYPCSLNCQNCVNTSTCTKCIAPFVLQETVCQDSCDTGFVNIDGVCKECTNSATCHRCDINNLDICKTCKDTFYLKDGQCVTDCLDNYFELDKGDLGDECGECKLDCKVCSNNSSCDECNASKVLFNNDCLTNCPSGFVSINRKCNKCDSDKCDVCETENLSNCTNCKPGYYLKDGYCLTDCGQGFFKDDSNMTCRPCLDANCVNCSSSTNCHNCGSVMVLYDNKCLPHCPSGYVDDTTGLCQPCSQSTCDVCLSKELSICTKCKTGFLLDGVCLTTCPITYFGDANTGECRKCKDNCDECTSLDNCFKCTFPTVLRDNKCIASCPHGELAVDGKCIPCEVNNCYNCARGVNTCDACDSSFSLLNDICYEKCPERYFSSIGLCKKCEDDCLACTSSFECKQCDASVSVLFEENCNKDCPLFTFKDVIANECFWCADRAACEICDASASEVCYKCANGFFKDQNNTCVSVCPKTFFANSEINECTKCKTNCSECRDTNTCEVCVSGFFLLNNECIPSCPSEYIPIGGVCVACTGANCDKCLASDLSQCTTCKPGFNFYKNQCLETCPKESTFKLAAEIIDSATIIASEETSVRNDQCVDCYSTCLTCDQFPQCTSCKANLNLIDGECRDVCPDKFASVNSVCKHCTDNNCKNCEPQNLDICVECLTGTFLYQGSCVIKCPEGFFADSDSKSCKECERNCRRCTNSTDCQECYKNFFFTEGTDDCDICLGNKVIINDTCLSCKAHNCDKCINDSDNICEICSGDFVLINGACHENCPLKTFKKGQLCENCVEGCTVCDNKDSCLICDSDKVRYNGQCIDNCPVNYVMNNDRECIKCKDDNCLVCDANNTSICDVCLSNFFLKTDGTCVQDCPFGTYEIEGKCKHCTENCKSCSPTECNLCYDDFFLKSGKCLRDCELGYRPTIDKKCVKCSDENCDKCTADECTKCSSPYLILEGTCVLSCSDGYFQDQSKCAPCPNGCISCSNGDTCDVCAENLVLHKSECLPRCPVGMAPVNGLCKECDDSNCLQCETNMLNHCLECDKGYLYAGRCLEICPDKTFVDSISKKTCIDCNPLCATCSNDKECNTCPDEFTLYEGKCLSKCPEKTVEYKEACYPCGKPNCSSCKFTGDGTNFSCLQCEEPTILLNDDCVSECPEGYFHNKLYNKCEKCSVGCKNCEDKSICTECRTNFFLEKNTTSCTQHCPDGTFGSCAKKECTVCDESCLICCGSSSADCLTCNKGFISMNNKCVSPQNCLEGFFADVEGGKCERCKDPNCKDCTNNESCITCKDEFSLKDGICKESNIVRSLFNGILLQSPYSPSYNQQSVFNFSELEGLHIGSNDLSISFYARSLGVTKHLNDQAVESHIFDLTTSSKNVSISFVIKRTEKSSECVIKFSYNDVITEIPSDTNCDDKSLYKWTFFAINLAPTSLGNYKLQISKFNEGDDQITTKTANVVLTGLDKVIDFSSIISLLNTVNSANLGYQLAKFNVGDYSFSADLLNKFTQSVPESFTWLDTGVAQEKSIARTENRTDSNTISNFIPLINGFIDLEEASFNLFDRIDNNSLTAAYTTYGISMHFYLTSLPTAVTGSSVSGKLVSISYPYDGSIGYTTALRIEISDVKETRVLNNTIQIPNILETNKWYILSAGVSATPNTVTYSIKIEDFEKKEILNAKISADDQVEQVPKLYIDANVRIGESLTGQAYNVYLLINSNEVNLKSVPTITNNINCNNFSLDMTCISCIRNHKLQEDNICVDDALNLSKKLLENFEVYNAKNQEIEIPAEFVDKDFTIFFYMRKLVHSIYDNDIPHSLISYRTSNNVRTILSELVKPDYVSKFVSGLLSFDYDFKNTVFDFFKVVITVNKSDLKLFVAVPEGTVYEGKIDLKDNIISKLILGDQFGREIHYQYLNAVVFPKELNNAEIDNLFKTTIIDNDPICVTPDFSTGICKSCPGGALPKNGLPFCTHGMYGYAFIYIYGHSSFATINNHDYIYQIKDNISPPPTIATNVNSKSYGLLTRFRFLSIPQLRNRGNAEYEIIKLRNNAHLNYYEQNPSEDLITFKLRIENGEGKYLWVINSAIEGRIEVEVSSEVKVKNNTWMLIGGAIDVVNNKFKYTIYFDESKEEYSGEYTFKTCCPEKLQSVGELVTFGAGNKFDDKLTVPYAHLVSAYVFPNLQNDKFSNVFNAIKNGDKFKPTTPEQVPNCTVPIHNPTSNTTVCVECESSYIIVNGVCVLSSLKALETGVDIGYQVLYDQIQIEPERTYDIPFFGGETVDVAFFFRINSTSQKAKNLIYRSGSLSIYITMIDYLIYVECEYLDSSFLMGELKEINIFKWHSLNISYDMLTLDKINFYLRTAGSSISNILESREIVIDGMIDFDNTATLYNNPDKISIQIYGFHALDGNYGYPALRESLRNDCGIDCTDCYLGICSSGKFGVSKGKCNLNCLSLTSSELILNKIPNDIQMSSLFSEDKLLRSNNFSIKLVLNANLKKVDSNGEHFFTIFKLKYSDTNHITLKVNKFNLQDYSLEYRNYFSNTHMTSSPIKLFSLPNEVQNLSLAIIVSYNGSTLDVIVYDSYINYVAHRIEVEGQLDYLSRTASIEFGQNVNLNTETSNLAIYNSAKLCYDREIPFENFLNLAEEMTRKSQAACEISDSDNYSCVKCKEGYQLLKDSASNSSFCAISGPVIANSEINYASDDHPLVNDFNFEKEEINKLTYSIQLKYPTGYTNNVGLIRIETEDKILVEVYSRQKGLRAINYITGKEIIIPDVLEGEDYSALLSLSTIVDFESGYFKIQTYSPSTDVFRSASASGTSIQKVKAKTFNVIVGFVNEDEKSETQFRFKTGPRMIYINNEDLSQKEIQETSLIQNKCADSCKTNCGVNNICPTDKLFNAPITLQSRPKLLKPLREIISDFTSTEEFSNYFINIKFSEEEYKNYIERNSVNSNILFVLSNNNKPEYDNYLSEDLMVDSLQEQRTLSIVARGKTLELNLFGGSSGKRFSLLPIGLTIESAKLVNIQIRVNTLTSVANIQVQLDDLVHIFSINIDNWGAEAVNRDSMIFVNGGVVATIDLDQNTSFGSFDSELVPDVRRCTLENCSTCLIGETGNATCQACSNGFNMALSIGICTPNANVEISKNSSILLKNKKKMRKHNLSK